MGFYLSPGQYVLERDLSTYIPAVATSIAGYVGTAKKGPVWQRTLVTNERYFSELFGEPTENTYEDFFTAAGYLMFGNTLYFVRVVDKATAKNAEIDITTSVATSGAGDYIQYVNSQEILNSSGIEYTPSFGGGEILQLFAKYPGVYGNTEIKTALINNTDWGTIATSPTLSGYKNTVVDPPASTDEFVLLVFVQNPDGTYGLSEQFKVSTTENKKNNFSENMYVEQMINTKSQYLLAFHNTGQSGEPASFAERLLTSGADGTPTESDVISGYDLFANPEEFDVNLLLSGSNTGVAVAQKIITVCETRMDCFGILDVPKSDIVNVANISTAINNVLQYRESELNPNTSYAALYAQWYLIKDKYNDKDRWIPGSGYHAGIYAKNDYTAEPWFAPAGLNRGVLKNVLKLAMNPDKGYRDILYTKGINSVVSFPSQGIVIWGQKTLLSKPSAFDRVNVRRLFIVLEKAISTASKYMIFEQNDEFTRSQLKNMIEPFLKDVKGRRGIYDFMVDVSSAVNTSERIDRNEMWCDIYISPTRSAENLVLRFNATRSGVSFEELIGQ